MAGDVLIHHLCVRFPLESTTPVEKVQVLSPEEVFPGGANAGTEYEAVALGCSNRLSKHQLSTSDVSCAETSPTPS